MDEATFSKIKEYIIRNYNPRHGSFTALRSGSNVNDVFDDGCSYGIAETLYDIGTRLGIKMEELETPSEDE